MTMSLYILLEFLVRHLIVLSCFQIHNMLLWQDIKQKNAHVYKNSLLRIKKRTIFMVNNEITFFF